MPCCCRKCVRLIWKTGQMDSALEIAIVSISPDQPGFLRILRSRNEATFLTQGR